MKYKIVIKPEAESDIRSAFAWYEARKGGLGVRFIDSISDVLELIEGNPYLFAKKYKDVRIAYTPTFPYGVHYKIEGSTVYVLTVLHAKRRPRT